MNKSLSRPKTVQQMVRQGAFFIEDQPSRSRFRTPKMQVPRNLEKTVLYQNKLQQDIKINQLEDKMKKMAVCLRKKQSYKGCSEDQVMFKKFRCLIKRNQQLELQLQQQKEKLNQLRTSVKCTDFLQSQIKEDEFRKQIFRLRVMVSQASKVNQKMLKETSQCEPRTTMKALKQKAVKRLKYQNINLCSMLSIVTGQLQSKKKQLQQNVLQRNQLENQLSQLRQSLQRKNLQVREYEQRKDSHQLDQVTQILKEENKKLSAQLQKLKADSNDRLGRIKELNLRIKEQAIAFEKRQFQMREEIKGLNTELRLISSTIKQSKTEQQKPKKVVNRKVPRVVFADIKLICQKIRLQMFFNEFLGSHFQLVLPRKPSVQQMITLLEYPPFLLISAQERILLARYLIQDNRSEKIQLDLQTTNQKQVVYSELVKAINPFGRSQDKRLTHSRIKDFTVTFKELVQNLDDNELSTAQVQDFIHLTKNNALGQMELVYLRALNLHLFNSIQKLSLKKLFLWVGKS